MEDKIRQVVQKLRNDPKSLYEWLDVQEQKIKKAKQQILRLIQKKVNQEKMKQSNNVPIQERVTLNIKKENQDG